MATIRVLFIVTVFVAIVTVSNGSTPSLGDKAKSLAKNPQAVKVLTKIKTFSEKHPKLKDTGVKAKNKLLGWKTSASESKQGVAVRGITRSATTRAKNVVDDIKTQIKSIKTMIRGAKQANKLSRKVSGLTKVTSLTSRFTKSKKKKVTKADKLKHIAHLGSNKIKSITDSKAVRLLSGNKGKSKTQTNSGNNKAADSGKGLKTRFAAIGSAATEKATKLFS